MVADPQGKIADIYRTYGIPIHFFVGRDGTIRDVRIGRLTPERHGAAGPAAGQRLTESTTA